MEDSFRVRVDKVFGYLEASSSSSYAYPSSSIAVNGAAYANAPSSSSSVPNLTSLWCLTDDEIERREWNRDKGFSEDDDDIDHDAPMLVSEPYAWKLDRLLANQPMPHSIADLQADLQELLDDPEDEDYQNEYEGDGQNQSVGPSSRQLDKPDDHKDEEWDIRSSVGFDSTLDLEEEEDVYDQVAIGKEADDLYRKDITDYEADMDSGSVLPKTFRDVTRDPRANHIAARIRLKEDAEAARDFDSLQSTSIKALPSVHGHNENVEDGYDLKSILRKRDNQMVKVTEKHVRFEHEFENGKEQGYGQSINTVMEEVPASDAVSFHSQDSPCVPDYVRNPSKYTHYTFDSLRDESEESNQKAYMDFLNLVRGPKTTETQDGVSRDLPKSVTFIARKKLAASFMESETYLKKDEGDCSNEYSHRKGVLLGIAAGDVQGGESCAMEEDELETVADKSSGLPKASRRYRTRACISLDEIVS